MTELVECNTQLHKTLQGLWSDALTQHKLQQQDDDTHYLPSPLTVVGLQDAHKIIANCQKMLQEWNKRYGPVAKLRI